MVPWPAFVTQQRSVARKRVVIRFTGSSRMSLVAHGCFENRRSTGDWFVPTAHVAPQAYAPSCWMTMGLGV